MSQNRTKVEFNVIRNKQFKRAKIKEKTDDFCVYFCSNVTSKIFI
jgi:hypothetical protein